MKKTWVLLFFIFLVSVFLRFNSLANIPVGFHIDEASLGYNAYSLLLTGKDENNQPFPLYIDMFGDNRPSGYHHLAILPVQFWGLTVFATRFPAAFFGAISIFAMFFLAYVLFRDKTTAFVASILMAIAPWHIVLSRASGEAVIALFFILIGFGLIFLSIQKKKSAYMLIGSLSLALSFFFYHTPRVFVPLLFFMYIGYFFWKFKSQINLQHKRLLIISFIAVSLVAFSLVFFAKGGTGRFSQVNIFTFPETRLVMEEQLREDGISDVNLLSTRAFHNKIVNYSLTFASNYLQYFSGEFLFIKGGLPSWYKVPNMGLIYIVALPFIIYGLFRLLLSKNQFTKLPIIWLVVAPVVAAATVDDIPNINRAIVLFPVIELIAAYGIVEFVKKFSSKKILPISLGVGILFFANFLYFEHQYSVHAGIHRNWFRDEGFGELVQKIKKDYHKSDSIVVTKAISGYPLILFYMQYDPKTYQAEGSPKDKSYSGFGKFIFVPQACPSLDRDGRFPSAENITYVDKGDCRDDESLLFKTQEYILRKDGTKAFRIVHE